MKSLLTPLLASLSFLTSPVHPHPLLAPLIARNDSSPDGPPVLSIPSLPPLPRLSLYYQTTHSASTGAPISMLPLITERGIALTHLIVCSFHINAGGVVHLNDYPPDAALFDVLWSEAAVVRAAGVKVMGMVGGAAPGSFDETTLDSRDAAVFALYYGQLRDVIARFGLQGLDIDVEQPMSLAGVVRLVRALRADFGPDFVITLAPVASALRRGASGANLSGFGYSALEAALGALSTSELAGGKGVDFYNAQFYNGFGSMSTTAAYDAAVTSPGNGTFAPAKVLAGQVTTPRNGAQWVPFPAFNATVRELANKYRGADGGGFGGVMGWEYFNGEPGGEDSPWQWAQVMTAVLRPELGMLPKLTVTRETAERLDKAWRASVMDMAPSGAGGGRTPQPDIDYFALVNA